MRIQNSNIAFGDKGVSREEFRQELTKHAESSARLAREAQQLARESLSEIRAIRTVFDQNRINSNPCAGKTCHNEVLEYWQKGLAFVKKIFKGK